MYFFIAETGSLLHLCARDGAGAPAHLDALELLVLAVGADSQKDIQAQRLTVAIAEPGAVDDGARKFDPAVHIVDCCDVT